MGVCVRKNISPTVHMLCSLCSAGEIYQAGLKVFLFSQLPLRLSYFSLALILWLLPFFFTFFAARLPFNLLCAKEKLL
jgi:hypothetical protein